MDFKFRDRADSDEDTDVYKVPKSVLSVPSEFATPVEGASPLTPSALEEVL